MKREVDILGVKYSISYKTPKEDKALEELAGYTDFYSKRIVVEDRKTQKRDAKDTTNIQGYEEKILKHEIVHAYLYESGLDVNSNRSFAWATNEEMVDWFAIQGEKIFKTYKELNIL